MDDETVVRVLNEWEDRYIRDPNAFEADFQTVIRHLAEKSNGETPSYGALCVAYMHRLDEELKLREVV